MKMSDVFNLPLSTEKVYKRLGHAWGIDENKVEAITTAINNHDRLEQENAELKRLLGQHHRFCKEVVLSLIHI